MGSVVVLKIMVHRFLCGENSFCVYLANHMPLNVVFVSLLYYSLVFFLQLSWIEQILQNPDVFCFADYPHKTVNLTSLKVQPEETRELSSW